MAERTYLPAAGRDAFLPFYDVITRLFGLEQALRALLAQAALAPHQVVLDIGCGTGTLAVLLRRLHPTIDVIGLDPDPLALARAAAKASAAGVAVRFDRGFADALPYPDATFDRVFSSMMFHHLQQADKPKVLAEIRRVLKPGAALEFLDFAGAHPHSFLARIFHGHQPLSPAAEGRMLDRLREAGFVRARRTGDRGTPFGRIAFYEGFAP
jgi:ubiquinone/menaquinone biosynthesis C-methylase UbiE